MKYINSFDWKATMIFVLFVILVASACSLPDLVGVFPGPDHPVDQPDTTGIDTITVVDTIPVDTTGALLCECDPDSLHLVTQPAFIQGWTEWDVIPDSVVWEVGPYYWTTYDNVIGTDLAAILEQVWPAYTWTVYDTAGAVVVFCDGTDDPFFTRQNIFSRPFLQGQQVGNRQMMTFNSQTLYTGGALSFDNMKAALIARPSTKGMNLRGSDFTLEQSMILWELLLQWCEGRVADPGAFPAYRADFRWGLYDPEIVTRFDERLWTTPTSFQEDPDPSPELLRA